MSKSVFDIIKKQIIQNESELQAKISKLKIAFTNGATLVIKNDYFTEHCSKYNTTWYLTDRALQDVDYVCCVI